MREEEKKKDESDGFQYKLIFTLGGRFPWARLQSPRHFVPVGLSARAVPTGVAALRFNKR